MTKRQKWIAKLIALVTVIVALLCAAAAGVTLWRFWPRSYSLADPRAYVPLEEVPVDEYGDLVVPVGKGVWWDWDTLRELGIQTYDDPLPRGGEEYTAWRQWSAGCTRDFLQRVSEGKEAVLRFASGEWTPDGLDHTVVEIRYTGENFRVTLDHRRCSDWYVHYGVVYFTTPLLKWNCSDSRLMIKADIVNPTAPENALYSDEEGGNPLVPAYYHLGKDGVGDEEFQEVRALATELTEAGLFKVVP